jgi:hypothetical protein
LFAVLVSASWVVGLLGLGRGRMSSFQLPIVVAAGLLGYWVVAAVRNRVLAGEENDHEEVVQPQTCVVVRRFGEGAERRERPAASVEEPHVVVPSPAVHADPMPTVPQRRPRKRVEAYIPLSGI